MDNPERKIILVPHCFMTKRFASKNINDTKEVIKILYDFKTGIVQMPCPHLFFLMNKGYKIEHPHCSEFIKKTKDKDSENLYEGIINPLLDRIENCRQLNFEITGILGIKGSPVCGIYNPEAKEYGSFINTLNKKLITRGIKLRMAVI